MMAAINLHLGNLPIELLQKIASYLPQHDVDSLRLVSKACLRLDIKQMFEELPFSISMKGLAKLRAISKSDLAKHVHRVDFAMTCKASLMPRDSFPLGDLGVEQLLHRGLLSSL